MIKAPMWFTALDLVLAYIPMGFLGWKLAGAKEDEVMNHLQRIF